MNVFKAPAKFVWLDGEIVPWDKATVHVFTHALHYGTGVFEGIRAYSVGDELLVFRLDDHLKRLAESAKMYTFNMPYTQEELHDSVLQLIEKNDFHSPLYIRPIAFKGVGGINLDARATPTSVSIIAYPYEKYFDGGKTGLDICVSSWRRVGEPAVPAMAKACGHYINSVLARTEAAEAGFDEALFLDSNGNVSEGTGENIFIVKNEAIFTPTFASDILNGITRQTVISSIHDLGMTLEERTVRRAELYTCDEAFFTGTAAEVAPILSIDRKQIGNGKPGRITAKLRDEYERIVTGTNEKYHNYLTSVYRNRHYDLASTRALQR
ncbi:MAG TPA: branched-chain amino acid transaminase [Methylomirabilota bacterium]|nr:branched-chain amino acid transaminase [Methylomirabilota bacterium]